MFDFLKKLYEKRHKMITIIMVEDDHTDEPSEYHLLPKFLFQLFAYSTLLILSLVIVVFGLTPVGPWLFDKEDEVLRNKAIQLHQQLVALEDSLYVRDQQLSSIKKAIYTNQDTVFSTFKLNSSDYGITDRPVSSDFFSQKELENLQLVNGSNIIGSQILNNTIKFPAPWPVDGTMTRTFDPESQHFGVDIATEKKSLVKSIADGVIISSVWTLNYGYVIQIQHPDGYISIIKHCSQPLKNEGDTIMRGDVVGIVGESGIISSGPHVHIELWRDGVPLDPELFLI